MCSALLDSARTVRIRTAKFAIGMTLVVSIVQWLERPAAASVYVATW